MPNITCDEAETLINEAASLGCRSPWEIELAKLALENRIATYLQGGGATRGAYRSVTTSGNVVSGDYLIIADATAGAITMTLPPAALVPGRIYAFKRINSGANQVIIDGYASETIDGATSHSMSPQWNSLIIMTNGVAWFKLADH
ncbi:MAG: hypothetical protein ACK5SP_00530 [bacterium]